MKKTIILLVSVLSFEMLYAQNEPFSNKTVQFPKWEETLFLPYAAGKLDYKNRGTYDPFGQGFSEKAAGALSQKLSGAANAIKSCPIMSPPQGVDVYMTITNEVRNSLIDSSPTLKGHISLGFLTLLQDKNGKQTRIMETSVWTNIWFNDPDKIVSSAPVVGDIFVSPERIDSFMGFPVFLINGMEVAIIHKNNIPLWVPVSREDCLASLIRQLKDQIDKEKAAIESENKSISAKGSPDSEKARRRKEFEESYKKLQAIDPSIAEEARRTFEETEKELSAAEVNNENLSSQGIADSQLKILTEARQNVMDELQSLTPEERKQQAYRGSSGENGRISAQVIGLTDSNMPGAEPLVRINPVLIEKSRPESDIQLIVVEWSGAQPFSYNEGKEGYNLQSWKQVEFSKETAVWNYIISMAK